MDHPLPIVNAMPIGIQGDCDDTGPPATARLGDAPRKKGQCVLIVGRLTLFVWQCKTEPLWIDNLYIRSQTLVMGLHRVPAPIRITNVTVQHTTGLGLPEADLGSWFVHRSAFWLHGVGSFLLEGAHAIINVMFACLYLRRRSPPHVSGRRWRAQMRCLVSHQ